MILNRKLRLGERTTNETGHAGLGRLPNGTGSVRISRCGGKHGARRGNPGRLAFIGFAVMSPAVAGAQQGQDGAAGGGPPGVVESLLASLENSPEWLSIAGAILLLVFLGTAVALYSRMRRSIHLTAGALHEASDEAATTMDSLTRSVDDVAEDVSQQTETLDRSTRALGELEKTTRRNAETAEVAAGRRREVQKAIEHARRVVSESLDRMEKTRESGEQIGAVVQTIHEIAFQTNLLALNAAVEAAHAGEYGAGFAVVAEEVRSLAMKAAEAAENTQRLIQANVEAIHSSCEMVGKVSEAFGSVLDHSKAVGGYIEEMAESSQQGLLELERVVTLIRQMEEAVRRSAETARASSTDCTEVTRRIEYLQSLTEDFMEASGDRGLEQDRRGYSEETQGKITGRENLRLTGGGESDSAEEENEETAEENRLRSRRNRND